MRPTSPFRLAVLAFLLLALLLACRREEEPEPTATPGAGPTMEATAEPTGQPTAPPATPIPSISEIDWAPQVVYSSPAPGEETALDGAITVRFDQPMDQGAVESAFAVTGVDGRAVSGQFSWPSPEVVIFTPVGNLQRQAAYRVTVGEAAEGVNGQPLRQPLELKLETVGYLKVSQIIPADGTRAVDTDGAITVLFNRPVVPLVATSQQADLPQPLRIAPPVAGTGTWVSSSIYRFQPDEPLAGGAAYEVTIPAGLTDVTGGLLESAVTTRFSTADPTVVSLVPADGATGVVPTEPVTVTFNMPMDRASVANALRLSPGVSLDLTWSEDGRVVTARPTARLALGTNYALSVDATARAAAGQADLGRAFSSRFTTVPLPAVVEVFPAPDREADRYQRGVNIRFASPMNVATLEDRIRIEPAPENINAFYNEFDNSYFLDFEPQRDTRYSVTVPASAADPYGNTLGADFTWSYTTPPFDPLVSLNLPFRVSQLSTSFSSDVEIVHRNVSRIDAALYAVDPADSLLVEPWTVYDYSPTIGPLATWSEPVSTPVDQAGVYSLALNGGSPLPTGLYFLSVSGPEVNRDTRYWQNQRHLLAVAGTNLVVKEMLDAVHVWATDLAGGQAVAGLPLALFDRDGDRAGEATTDASGFASFPYDPPNNYLSGVIVIGGQPGQPAFGIASSEWHEGASPWEFGLEVDWNEEPSPFAYIYTDRPIYRPGDTVHFRGIVRDPAYGRYRLPSVRSLTAAISFYFNYDEPAATFDVALAADGTFAGSYDVPPGADLGPYRLYLQAPSVQADRTFQVAEYRRPEFLVEVLPATRETLRGQPVDVNIRAEYLFGAPAADLDVNWTVYQRPFTLPWEGPFYRFSPGDEGFFRAAPIAFGASFDGEPILSGRGRTNERGDLALSLPAGLLAEVERGSRQITVEATVFDVSDFPISARAGIVFHDAEVYVGIAPASYVDAAGTDVEVNLVTVDWDAQPVPNTRVAVIFSRREYEPRRVNQFGARYTEWDAVDTEVFRTDATTDDSGRAVASFVPPSGGTYVAEARVLDRNGRESVSNTFLWITDANFVGWRAAARERRMDMTPDKPTYQVGDTARVLVQSPFAGPVQAWLTVERGELIEQRLITLATNSEVLEIPIRDTFAPNVFVSVVAVQGTDGGSRFADIRLGVAELEVSPERLLLDIALVPRDDRLEPRETAVFDIRVTDYLGRGVAASLSLALVDEGVLSLLPDNAPPIAEAFYRPQPYRSQIGAGLFVSGEGLDVEIPLEQLGMGGGGGGEALATDAARLEGEEGADAEVRQDFRDTAYWNATVRTDALGEATVAIPLPDNLTTWRLSAKAVTEDTLVGQDSVNILVTKPLLVRPVTPRFFTVGDELRLGAVVQNNTNAALDVTARLEATGVTIEGSDAETVRVNAGQGRLVQWTVSVQDVPAVDLVFRVQGGGYRDASRPTVGSGPDRGIPTYRYSAADIVGTAGVLAESGRVVEGVLLPPGVDSRLGDLRIALSPSLAAAVLEALEAIDRDPGDRLPCAPTIVDELLPNIVTARALRALGLSDPALAARLDALLDEGLAEVARLQRPDGGWGWCFSDQSDPYLSGYVLLGLAKAREAGHDVERRLVDDGVAYVLGRLGAADDLTEASDVNRQAFFLYVLAENGANVTGDLDALFAERRNLLDPHARALTILAYERVGAGAGNQRTLLSDLANSAVLSASGAHWEDASRDWRNLSSDIRGTAMVLDAYARVDPDNPLAANAVRWLMTAREASRWPSGQENSWAVLALTDWMAATGELEAGFGYGLTVNTDMIDRGEFGARAIADVREYSVPVSSLRPEAVNYLFLEKLGDAGRLYYSAHLNSFIDAGQVPAVSRGVTVQRVYYDAACTPTDNAPCPTIDRIPAGGQVRVELTIIAPNDLVYALIEDPFPAGAEGIDPALQTSTTGAAPTFGRIEGDYQRGYWGWWYFNRIAFRDDRVSFYSDYLPAGTYQYTYTLQASIPGRFQVRPATARETFFPEAFGRSDGLVFEITQ